MNLWGAGPGTAARRGRIASLALLALALLSLGGALHFKHHLDDPDCAEGLPAGPHACVCAGLHAGALVEDSDLAAVDGPLPARTTLAAVDQAPRRIVRGRGSPRAPPLV